MTYCATQDLIDRYGEFELIQLTDSTGAGAIDQTVVDRAIADVDGEIDAYLAKRVALPLATVPPVLVRMACVMVRYYLYKDVATDLVKQQYDAAIRFLRDVAAGTTSLGADAAGDPTPDNGAPAYVQGDGVFSGDGMDGY